MRMGKSSCIFVFTCVILCQMVSGLQNVKKFHVCFDVYKNWDLSLGKEKSISCGNNSVIYMMKETYNLREHKTVCGASSGGICTYEATGGNYNIGTGSVCNGLKNCTGEQIKSTLQLWTEGFIKPQGFKPCMKFTSKYLTVSVEYICIDESRMIDMCIDFEDGFPGLNHLWIGNHRPRPLQCKCTIRGNKLTVKAMQVYSNKDGDSKISLFGKHKECTVNEINIYNRDLSCIQTNVEKVDLYVNAGMPHGKFWIRIESSGRQQINCSPIQLKDQQSGDTITTTMAELDESETFPGISNTTIPQTNLSVTADIPKFYQRWYFRLGIISASTAGGVIAAIMMVAVILFGCSQRCHCYKRYASLQIKREVNIYTEVNRPNTSNPNKLVQTKIYTNCIQSECHRDSVNSVHSYADILDPNDQVILELKNARKEKISSKKETPLYQNV